MNKLITLLSLIALTACGDKFDYQAFINVSPVQDRIQRGVPDSDWCFDSEILGDYENGLTVNGDCTISQNGESYKLNLDEGTDPVFNYNRETGGAWIESQLSDLCTIQLFHETLRINCSISHFSYTGARTLDRTLPPGEDPYPINPIYGKQ